MRKVLVATLLALAGCSQAPPAGAPLDIPPVVGALPPDAMPVLPVGYAAAPAASGLVDPRAVAFDESGNAYVLEGGPARLSRVGAEGGLMPLAKGGGNGPWTGVARLGEAFYVAEAGGPLGGRILRIAPDGAVTVAVAVKDLPAGGVLGPLAPGPDGALYLGVATAAEGQRGARDVPCQDVRLQSGDRIQGAVPCTGSVLRIDPRTRQVAVHAWGFTDPVGLAFSPRNGLLVADDLPPADRVRPQVAEVDDLLWKVTPGVWYGWPDYLGQVASADPQLAVHPNPPPPPVASLKGEVRAVAADTPPLFGGLAQAYVALRTDKGGEVAFATIDSGVTQPFAANLKNPTAVAFGPGGDLWVADAGTGRLWKIAAFPMP